MRKRLKDLTLKDNFMFGAVMAEEANCRALLERITEIPIEKVEISREKTIVYHPEYKGVRLDIYAKDENNTHYNVEMQVAQKAALGRRARFYRSQMDMELLLAGEEYARLPDSYVIFICDYDPFGGGYYRYSFESRCLEDASQNLKEGCRYIFLNTLGKKAGLVSESLIRFLHYIHADLEASKGDFQDPFVRQLQQTVARVKESREMEERYMVFEEMLQDERKTGRAEGRAESRAEDILDFLSEMGPVPAELETEIRSQRDLELLRSWVHLAARTNSIEEFTEKIHG